MGAKKKIESAFYNFPTFLHRDKKKIKKLLQPETNNVSANELEDVLNQQRLYTLFRKPSSKKFKTNHYYVSSPNELFEMDLMYLNKYGV